VALHLEEQAEERAVVREVREAYLAWLLAFGVRDILRTKASDARELRESEAARVAEGSERGAEIASARYDEAEAELELQRAEAALELARLELERAIGDQLSSTAEPDLALLGRSAPATETPSPEAAALEGRRDALLATAEAHRSGSLPVVGANADLGLRAQGATVFPLYRVGLTLSIPLLDGGAQSALANEAASRAGEFASLAGEARAGAAIARRQAVRSAKDQRELDGGDADAVVRARIRLSRAELEVLVARVTRVRAILALSEPSRR
jgi:outer membrane protein TolC